AFFRENIGRFPGFGQARAEPATGTLAGRFFERLGALADVGTLVLDLLHIALGVAVANELPLAFDAGFHDAGIRLHADAVDVHHAGNPEFVIDLQQPPETDAISVFMPTPV